MFPIQRSAGHIPGISWGTSYNGFAWAVAVATYKVCWFDRIHTGFPQISYCSFGNLLLA